MRHSQIMVKKIVKVVINTIVMLLKIQFFGVKIVIAYIFFLIL